MVQAAAQKGLDYETADLRGRWWWLRASWLLNQLEDNNSIEILKLQHAQHSAVLDYTLEKSAFDNHWNGANEILRIIQKVKFPWDVKLTTDKSSDITKMLADWKRIYGDLNDPKVKDRYDRVAAAMRKRAAEGVKTNFAASREDAEKMRRITKKRKRKK